MKRRWLLGLGTLGIVAIAVTLVFLQGTAPQEGSRIAVSDVSEGVLVEQRIEAARQRRARGRGQRADGADTLVELIPEPEPELVELLRFQDEHGRPVAGVPVSGWGEEREYATSDADGIVRAPLREGVTPDAIEDELRLGNIRLRRGEVLSSRGVTVLPDLVPLEVELVDAETGTPIGGSVEVASEGGAFVPLRSRSGVHVLDPAPIQRAEETELRFRIHLPPGYVSADALRSRRARQAWPDEAYMRSAEVSRYAERVHVTLPVRPEARIRVRVVDEADEPIEGATVLELVVAGCRVKPTSTPTNERGEMVLRGVPFFRGSLLRVQVATTDHQSTAVGTVTLADPDSEAQIRVVVRAHPESIGAYRGPHGEVPSCGLPWKEVPNGATAVLWVVRRGGAPANRAFLRLRRKGAASWDATFSDSNGRAIFSELPPGHYTAQLCEPGLVFTEWTFDLTAAETLERTVHESVGHRLPVVVHGVQDLALPFARVFVSPEGSDDLTWLGDDGVQHLDIHTDRDGRVVIPHLPGEKAEVSVQYGHLCSTSSVSVRKPLAVTLSDSGVFRDGP